MERLLVSYLSLHRQILVRKIKLDFVAHFQLRRYVRSNTTSTIQNTTNFTTKNHPLDAAFSKTTLKNARKTTKPRSKLTRSGA